jgi:hypothetical protein
MVTTLAAYLVKIKENDVIHYFTVDAIERSKLLKWDNNRQYFMTDDEIYYDEMDPWKDATSFGLDINSQQLALANQVSNTTGVVAAQVANIEAQSTRVERIFTGTEDCSIGTAQSRLSRLRTKRLTGIMEDESTIGSASTSKTARKEKEDHWDQQLKIVTANQATTARTLEDMTILLQKVLGISNDKTIRVIEPSSSNTTDTPHAGSTSASGEEK